MLQRQKVPAVCWFAWELELQEMHAVCPVEFAMRPLLHDVGVIVPGLGQK